MKSGSVWILIVTGLLMGCQAATSPVEPPLRITFVSNRDGNAEIYIMDHDGSHLTNLTHNDSGNDALPTWSHAANAFAFVTKADKGGFTIRRMNIDGSDQVILSQKPPLIPIPLVWNSTGEWLAFGSEAAADVYVISATGDTVRNLSNFAGRDDFQSWSPDGQSLLFTSSREGNLAIYRVGVEGGEPTRLTELGGNSSRPAWSPDGRKIAFMADYDGGDVEIYVMGADGGNVVQLTDSRGFDGYPAWSPDGVKIAFSSLRDGDNEIYVMNVDGSEQSNLTRNPDSQEAIRGDFAWSPDGRKILYHSDKTGNADVYVMDAAGGNQTNLTRNPAMDFSAIWVQ
jgi:Tol biopolymer transport system component